MELTQLRYFKTVAETLNFSKAADMLHVTRPAISTSMQHLEDELGTRLFNRTNNRLSLTESGKILFSHIEPIENEINAIIQEINSNLMKDISCTIASPIRSYMYQCIKFLSASYRNVNPYYGQIDDNDTYKLLENNEVDIIISNKRIDDYSCMNLLAGFDSCLVVVNPSSKLVLKKYPKIEDLEGMDFCRAYTDNFLQDSMLNAIDNNNINIKINYIDDIMLNQMRKIQNNSFKVTGVMTDNNIYKDISEVIQLADMPIVPIYISFLKSKRYQIQKIVDMLSEQILNRSFVLKNPYSSHF